MECVECYSEDNTKRPRLGDSVKGDEIVGYISRGNGIIVHTKNRNNFRNIDDKLIDVSWNKTIDKKFETNT